MHQGIEQSNWLAAVSFSPDGQTFATAGADNTVKLWRLDNGQLERTFQGHEKPVMDVSFSPDGQRIASASEDGTIRLWTVTEGKIETTINVGSTVFGVDFINNEKIASANEDGTLTIWSLPGNLIGEPLRGHSNSVLYLDISPDGKIIASASEDKTVKTLGYGIWSITANS